MIPYILWSLLLFILSYLCGSIPFGYLIGKFNGIDIRKYGSHNIGATNIRRVLGRDWSIVCFICDFSKGLLPVLIIGHWLGAKTPVGYGWGGFITAIAAVSGHVFPVWLGFKGGKGVATSLGVIAGIAFWPAVVGGLGWLAVFYRTRIVSLASIISVVVIAIAAVVMRLIGWSGVSWPGICLLCILAAIVVIRHKENIMRLRSGTENAFAKPKAKN